MYFTDFFTFSYESIVEKFKKTIRNDGFHYADYYIDIV